MAYFEIFLYSGKKFIDLGHFCFNQHSCRIIDRIDFVKQLLRNISKKEKLA